MNPIYARRRRKDIIIRVLCLGAALFGVTWLALILFTLFYNGLSGINLAALHPEHAAAGLERRRPAQRHHRLDHHDRDRGRHRRAARPVRRHLSRRIRQARPLTSVIRFINDILLSAPSIIIGLFIYGAVVVPMRGFSAIAGASRSR